MSKFNPISKLRVVKKLSEFKYGVTEKLKWALIEDINLLV